MSREEQDRRRVLADLYEGTFDATAWDRGLRGLARLVGGQGPLLMACDMTTGAVTRHVLYDYSPSVFVDYSSHWIAHDHRLAVAAKVPVLNMFTESSLRMDGRWEDTLIFNEFLKPTNAGYVLGSNLHCDSRKFTMVCIQATLDRGPFSPEDAAYVVPLMAHLRRSLEIKDRLERHGLRADAIRGIVDGLSFGIVVLDERQRILEASDFASRALQQVCTHAPLPGEALRLPEPQQRELSALLSSSLTRGALSDGLLHVPRGALQMPLSILVAPAPAGLQTWILNSPAWLLFLFDPEQRLKVSCALLEAQLRLTPREAQIASLLATGLTLPLIAARLGISLHTLRTHLKTCMAKTGTHTQSALVLQVMASAAAARQQASH